MSQTAQLLVGLAELLDTAGAGTYDEDDPVAEGQTAIVLIRLPESPTKIISLRSYDTADDPKLSERELQIQVRTRGGKSPLEALDLAELVYAAFHGINGVFVNATTPVHIVQMWRSSETDMGPDSLGRFERSENYTVQLNSDLARLE